jgi:hypothetical protein
MAMALGFRFEELPALHGLLALSSLIIGQCALHGVMTLGIRSGKCSRFRSMAISLSGDPK